MMVTDVKETRAKNLYRGLITSARTYAQANRVHAGVRFQRSFKDHQTYGVLIYHDADLQSISRRSEFPGANSPDASINDINFPNAPSMETAAPAMARFPNIKLSAAVFCAYLVSIVTFPLKKPLL